MTRALCLLLAVGMMGCEKPIEPTAHVAMVSSFRPRVSRSSTTAADVHYRQTLVGTSSATYILVSSHPANECHDVLVVTLKPSPYRPPQRGVNRED